MAQVNESLQIYSVECFLTQLRNVYQPSILICSEGRSSNIFCDTTKRGPQISGVNTWLPNHI